MAGAMAELRNVQENTELEVLPIADLFKESAKYHLLWEEQDRCNVMLGGVSNIHQQVSISP